MKFRNQPVHQLHYSVRNQINDELWYNFNIQFPIHTDQLRNHLYGYFYGHLRYQLTSTKLK